MTTTTNENATSVVTTKIEGFVFSNKIDAIRRTVDSMNKPFGFDPAYTLVVGETSIQPTIVNGISVKVKAAHIEIFMKYPIMGENWTSLGAVRKDGDHGIVFANPEVESNPIEQYRNIENVCDICGKKSSTRETLIIVRNEGGDREVSYTRGSKIKNVAVKEGGILRIGCNCFSKINGVVAMRNLDKLFNENSIRSLISDIHDTSYFGSYGFEDYTGSNISKYPVDIDSVINVAALCIKHHGFIKSNAGDDSNVPTKIAMSSALFDREYHLNAIQADRETNIAEEFKKYISSKVSTPSSNTFINNIATFIELGYATTRDFGFIAAAVHGFYQSETDATESIAFGVDSGKRVTEALVVRLARPMRTYDTQFGSTLQMVLKDESNHVFMWYSSSGRFPEYIWDAHDLLSRDPKAETKSFTLKSFSIKEFKENVSGIKGITTMITRARFAE